MGIGRAVVTRGGSATTNITVDPWENNLESTGFGRPNVTRFVTGLTNIQWAQGTWATQQITSVTDFNDKRATILSALQHPGVVGLSMRWPWKNFLDPTSTGGIMDLGRDVADEAGKRFCVRFMAGQHTPDFVFNNGAANFLLSNGNRCPKPWQNSTTSPFAPNTVFENAWIAYVNDLAAYSKTHGMRVLHLSWYGALWAELFHGTEVQNASGYTYDNWLTGHRRLVDLASGLDDNTMALEVATTGHGTQGTVFNDVVGYIQTVNGASFPEWWIQQNNYDVGTGNTVTRTVHSAAQMVDIVGRQDWTPIYDQLVTNGKKYIEIYIYDSFRLGNTADLFAEAAAFPYFA